ncbi:MAG: hypothetical protein M1824_000794 [Vezdaea acicularis]|nr:MAG: hypothetical protein M1824_000794 [Vezdaea acicularis]
MAPIPITIITGFLGSGKTTLILNLITQLPPNYRLALLKNEFGDLAIDSQLASSRAISGVQELLNGCICCNLVGQLGEALDALREDVKPDRIVIETSGSAFPATLAMEVNRLGEGGKYVLDGVIVVIDVENWKGYEDTSYTAKLQAKFTDMIVFNKWETVDERKFDDCLDRLGDLEVDIPWVKSNKGFVGQEVILGIDGGLSKGLSLGKLEASNGHDHGHEHEGHGHADHQSEVEVLSVSMKSSSGSLDMAKLRFFLKSAPKDEMYRIKAILTTLEDPDSSKGSVHKAGDAQPHMGGQYIINWAFGRWTSTKITPNIDDLQSFDLKHLGNDDHYLLRMTIILARYEANKWKKRIEEGLLSVVPDNAEHSLKVERVL